MELIADSVGSLNPRSEARYISDPTRIHLYRVAIAFVYFVLHSHNIHAFNDIVLDTLLCRQVLLEFQNNNGNSKYL